MKPPFLKRLAKNHLFILFFINGFFIALFLNFKMEDHYEKRLFESIAKNITQNAPQNEDSIILRALHISHALLSNRQDIFQYENIGFKSEFLNPISVDLMTGKGACGSYTKVLVRLLKTLGFQTRIAQMTVNGQYGGHIIAEVLTTKGWVVLDPLYNLHFKDAAGGMPAFDAVARNWNYYKHQVPENYKTEYSYDGVRYTNWTKIPLLSPLAKKVLDLFIGKEKADKVSIRTFILRDNLLFCYFFLFGIILLTFYKVVKIFKLKIAHFYFSFRVPILQPLTRKVINFSKMFFLILFLFSLVK